jgi:hypothetical protein
MQKIEVIYPTINREAKLNIAGCSNDVEGKQLHLAQALVSRELCAR